MKQNLASAIEAIQKQEEAGLNYIYAKTYNYVYLRAKSILQKESDVQLLMQETYLKMLESAEILTEETLYGWLGTCVYILGCAKYRKKKAREAILLEMERSEFETRKSVDLDKSAELIMERMEELPDLYQATFYAFYYDYMPISEIAQVMEEAEGVIINRLNYIRKYMLKVLEDFQQEKKVQVAYSVEAVTIALRNWSMGNCLGITTAQFVYSEICKKAGLKANPVYLEGKEFAGVNNTVVYHKIDDIAFLQEQFETYTVKDNTDKKKIAVIVGVAVLVLVVLMGIILALSSGKKDKDSQPENNVEQDQNISNEDENAETGDSQDEDLDGDSNQDELDGEDSNNQAPASEYIFPDSNTRELSRSELEPLSKEQLRLARNEIFARHGMIFGVADLDQYFGAKSWYKPSVSSDDFYTVVNLSDVERTNIDLIISVEDTK